jgi:hypothetical protein
MELLARGTRIRLNDAIKEIDYVTVYKEHQGFFMHKLSTLPVHLTPGLEGRIINAFEINGNEYAVEFDQPIYPKLYSSIDTTCNSIGKQYHCMFIPKNCFININDDSSIQFKYENTWGTNKKSVPKEDDKGTSLETNPTVTINKYHHIEI